MYKIETIANYSEKTTANNQGFVEPLRLTMKPQLYGTGDFSSSHHLQPSNVAGQEYFVSQYPLREPLIVLAKPSMHLCRYGEQKYISSADHAVSHRSLQSKLHNSESLLPAA